VRVAVNRVAWSPRADENFGARAEILGDGAEIHLGYFSPTKINT